MTHGIVVATSTCGLDTCPDPHHIRMLRLHVLVNGKDYLDGKDIQSADFHQWMLRNPDNLAKTSPPTQQEMLTFFHKLVREGYKDVLVVTLSARLSKTFEMVQQFSKIFSGKLAIHVFDTQTVSHGEAIYALEADRCMRAGMPMEAILKRLQLLRANSTLFITVGKLDYLVKNGRLSATGGMLANLAQIKPVLQVTEGEIRPFARVRKVERALEAMADAVVEYIGNHRFELVISEGGVDTTNHSLFSILRDKYKFGELLRRPVSSVIAAHSGPDVAGLQVIKRPPALQGAPV